MILRKVSVTTMAAVVGLAIAVAADQRKAPAEKPADQPAQKQATAKPAVQPQAAQGGLTVFIDPATGKIREPEHGEMRRLLPTRPAVSRDAVERFGPGRAVGVATGPEHMSHSVARIGPDGKLQLDCVHGKEKAEPVLRTPAKERADEKE